MNHTPLPWTFIASDRRFGEYILEQMPRDAGTAGKPIQALIVENKANVRFLNHVFSLWQKLVEAGSRTDRYDVAIAFLAEAVEGYWDQDEHLKDLKSMLDKEFPKPNEGEQT